MQHESLLPANATQFERDVEATMSRIGELHTDVEKLWNPRTCPEEFLPFLAWTLSVDVWVPDWPVVTKRQVCMNAVRFHEKKGTLAGHRWAASLAGGEVVSVIQPPAKMHIGQNLTTAQWLQFLSRYPQLRIYRHRTRGTLYGIAARYGGVKETKTFLGVNSYAVLSEAEFRLSPQSFVYDPQTDIETPLTTVQRVATTREETVVEAVEVRKRMQAVNGFYAGSGGYLVGRHTYDNGGEARYYTLRDPKTVTEQDFALARRTVTPALDPISVRFEKISQTAVRPYGMYPGVKGYVGGHMVTSTASDRIFTRQYLFDPKRSLESRGRSLHLGSRARLNFPHHHAELTVKIHSQRSALRFGRFASGFLVTGDMDTFHRVIDALRWNKRSSDKVVVSTRTRAPLRASESRVAGRQLVAGDWIEVS